MLDKWKYIERLNSQWENSLKDRDNPYWWKNKGESLEMVWSCLEEID